MHETGHSGLVHWDDPEGWNGWEVGGGFRMGNKKKKKKLKNPIFARRNRKKAFK